MYFFLYQSDKNRQWYWKLRSANHATVADGAEGYTEKRGALNGIGLVKSAVPATLVWDESTRAWA